MTHRIFAMPFSRVYPLYLAKVERKGRSRAEVDQIIHWLTGYDAVLLQAVLDHNIDCTNFFAGAPVLNPAREQITGVICGVRIEQISEPLMREIRILDKMIDDLAKGKPMAKILADQ
jgi:hypothetical protein